MYYVYKIIIYVIKKCYWGAWCDYITSFYCTFLEFMALSLKEVSCPWIRPFLMPKVKYKKIELY